MTAEALTDYLYSKGLIETWQVDECTKELACVIKAKGEEGATRVVRETFNNKIRSIQKYFLKAFASLPDKAKTIDDEIKAEDKDYQEWLEFFALMDSISEKGEPKSRFRRSEDYKGKELPTYLFQPAKSMTDAKFRETVQKYVDNTWIQIREEAQAEGTSMHEICRRKGLIYEGLIGLGESYEPAT